MKPPTKADLHEQAPGSMGSPTVKPPFNVDVYAWQATSAEGSEAHAEARPMSAAAVTALEEPFDMPERDFFDGLNDRARRVELMNALLAAGGMPRESAVRTLQAALGAIVASANDAHLPSLAALASALRTGIAHLGIGTPVNDDARVVDVLVFDESEVSRDLVALAVEAHGHTVRCAATYAELVKQMSDRKPNILVTEAELSIAPAKQFCETLGEMASAAKVPIVLFSDMDGAQLQELARVAGARRCISKEMGVEALIAELRQVFKEVLDIRNTGARPAFR